MKFKRYTLISLVLITISLETVEAQEKGTFRVNGGLTYGSKFGVEEDFSDSKGALGFNLGAEYLVGEDIGLALGYSQYAKQNATFSEDGFTIDAEVWVSTIDFDLRYYFLSDAVQVYGLLGYSNVKVTAEISLFGFTEKDSETDNAFNLGMGAMFPLSEKVAINTQAKWHKMSEEGHFVANLGIMFQLN
ncbi:Opacity protein [Reichenbachiella faecimaris]|uniref:Opacity protein n=1 Tax=Reichenbachiella faecimaris TaxID=692418 RepID=A0A1W2GKH3_REIFA|nr:porin family protein [Reichenbachiella faecimaris]SMD37071.1 Opacity protein [Reichenbachiella faecimaris]